jgi:hypothetical protein
MTAAGVFAEPGSPGEIHAALRQRFDALQISRLTIDDGAGLPDGYASKVLCSPPMKGLSVENLCRLLVVAGLRLNLVEDPVALARVTARLPKRDGRAVRVGHQRRPSEPAGIGPSRTVVLSELGREGGKARMAQLTPEARRELAIRAAAARWGKVAPEPAEA